MKKYKLLLILMMIFQIIFACRYTVREIGYSDINYENIQVTISVDSSISNENFNKIKNIIYGSLFDSNLKYNFNKTSLSQDVILSLDNFHDTLNIKDDDFQNQLWICCENLVSSPKRDGLLKNLVNSYAIILVINNNSQLQKDIKSAIGNFNRIIKTLPKAVNDGIKIIEIDSVEIQKEKFLLQYLKIKDLTKSHIVVFYGRGRKMGPVLSGNKISQDKIFNLISIIGADCECGLDVNWKLGKMIPLRWNDENNDQLYEKFGFDVNNPIIKDEMGKILAIENDRCMIDNPLEKNIIENSNVSTSTEIKDEKNYFKFFMEMMSIAFFILFSTILIILKKRKS